MALYGKQGMTKDEYETHLSGILWYDDGSNAGSSKDNPVIHSGGCAECDITFTGDCEETLALTLSAHVIYEHGVMARVKIDGWTVIARIAEAV